MQVNLFKRRVPYVDKDGENKIATNFFVECGDVLVPIEAKYFENKETGRDDRYMERKTLLSAFSDMLPERTQNNAKAQVTAQAAAPAAPKGKQAESKGKQAVQAEQMTDEQFKDSIPF